jgi:molecular chaperone GrpE
MVEEDQAKVEGEPEAAPQEALETQLEEAKKKYLYLYAEFENFRKRNQKERADLLKFGWEYVAKDLLQVVDNLDRAVEHLPKSVDTGFAEGIRMIRQQFQDTLDKHGVQAIETKGKSFDPNLHEALAMEPDAESAAGLILKEHTKGFTLHGRLLRAAKVVVSAGPETKA